MTNHATSFLSITSHWLDEDFNHYIAVLRAIHVPRQHTGQHLSAGLNTALDNFDIPKSKIQAIVTDGGMNIISATCIACLNRQPCFIHGLQRTIETKFFSQTSIKNIIAKNRKICTHFNHSALATNNLFSIQRENTRQGEIPLQIIQDVSTRWNSRRLST